MVYLIGILVGYGLGCVNAAYFLARLRGFDIRDRGSKNAGASNVVITLGKKMGLLCAAFDMAKAIVAVWMMAWLFPETNTFAVTASACILGHIFPFYMGFRGGKGLACLGGAILAFDLRVFVALLIFEVFVVLVSRYICFVPITASAMLPLIYGFMHRDLWGAMLLAGVGLVIFCKHLVNIRRILQGRELRLSYLWARDKETQRIEKQYRNSDESKG
ncbi:MAG: glycerol-3-phosphate acyltransferase [Clostridia bacterium]|nr:glycerol-3-phosphate acyltransferase [Clostridia bacterium]